MTYLVRCQNIIPPPPPALRFNFPCNNPPCILTNSQRSVPRPHRVIFTPQDSTTPTPVTSSLSPELLPPFPGPWRHTHTTPTAIHDLRFGHGIRSSPPIVSRPGHGLILSNVPCLTRKILVDPPPPCPPPFLLRRAARSLVGVQENPATFHHPLLIASKVVRAKQYCYFWFDHHFRKRRNRTK